MIDAYADDKLEQAVLHLCIITALILFVLFFVMEDIERLKRITAPRLIVIAPPQRETPAGDDPPGSSELLEGEILN